MMSYDASVNAIPLLLESYSVLGLDFIPVSFLLRHLQLQLVFELCVLSLSSPAESKNNHLRTNLRFSDQLEYTAPEILFT